ncbi:outer membrane usher protein [Serratia fonticola]
MASHFSGYIIPTARRVGLSVSLMAIAVSSALGQDIQFNTDILDVKDRANIDLSQFSQRGYIMPGTYFLQVLLNRQSLSEREITFKPLSDDPKSSVACLTPDMVSQLGIKPGIADKLVWMDKGACLDIQSLEGLGVHGDLGTSTLNISIPQAYLEYSSPDWDPPSRWDEGIPGLLLDYNINAQSNRQQSSGTQGYNVSGNGTTGANLGAWRLRADWQGRLDHQTGISDASERNWDWSRYYAYRAISRLKAKLTVGEDFLNSDIFDSFRYTGISLVTDDNMLPPNLRGYAPEVSGMARTNARVTISQQGRVLYETQVAAGPFRIQDLSSAVSGMLDVRVEEQDGTVQTFRVDTASIPYLTRPGQVRYKLASGRPTSIEHRTDGQFFTTGEASWGISNGWSLYGGGIAGGDYNALSLGVGRDLLVLGAISFDVTQSRAQLPGEDVRTGGSYRINYSKRFEDYDSQVTFAGYRFSERNFMTMGEFLNARHSNNDVGSNKEMYTVSFNKQFTSIGLGAYLNYYHQTYWDKPTNDRYNLQLAKAFDFGSVKNVSVSMTAYRNQYNNTNDDGVYLSLSMPWGNSGSLSYSSAFAQGNNRQSVGYYDRVNDRGSYQVMAGTSNGRGDVSGFYTHQGDMAQVSANASYRDGQYSSVGLALQGGATVTAKGGALHRTSVLGGTRLLLDTDGVPNVPVRGYGTSTNSNAFGKAVVTDVNSYYRNTASVDLESLGDNAEATRSVVQATLTEGAIGYRKFDVISGAKAMAVLRLADGSTPPFGASVLNLKKQVTGLVSDEGNVYLSGIQPGETMMVSWNGREQCQVRLPDPLPSGALANLLLPCVAVVDISPKVTSESDRLPAAILAKSTQ